MTGDDRPTGDASHEYEWRCSGCKARYADRPERCEHCGATEFLEIRDL